MYLIIQPGQVRAGDKVIAQGSHSAKEKEDEELARGGIGFAPIDPEWSSWQVILAGSALVLDNGQVAPDIS